MADIISILNLFFQSVFTGFGIVIPIMRLFKKRNNQQFNFKEVFIKSAIQLVRVSGLLYFSIKVFDGIYLYYNVVGEQDMVFGKYWQYYWFPVLATLFLTQLLWIPKLYKYKPLLIIISLLILLFPHFGWLYERFVIWMTMFHRDYLPSSWTMYSSGFSLWAVLLNIIVFIFTVFTIMLTGKKFKSQKV